MCRLRYAGLASLRRIYVDDFIGDLQRNLWDQWADTFDSFHAGKDPAKAAVFLSTLRPGGRFLELGVGTGRVAIALAGEGATVTGVDISPKMIQRLEEKVANVAVEGVVADMSRFSSDDTFDCVYAVDSSLFSVLRQADQVGALRSARACLNPGGVVVVENYLPQPQMLRPARGMNVRRMDDDSVDLSVTATNFVTQEVRFSELRIKGGQVDSLPVRQRYIWPSELDLMAELAGLKLESRFSDFDRSPLTNKSAAYVSVFVPGVLERREEV
jgi:SAM-dependent methyltransferase